MTSTSGQQVHVQILCFLLCCLQGSRGPPGPVGPMGPAGIKVGVQEVGYKNLVSNRNPGGFFFILISALCLQGPQGQDGPAGPRGPSGPMVRTYCWSPQATAVFSEHLILIQPCSCSFRRFLLFPMSSRVLPDLQDFRVQLGNPAAPETPDLQWVFA